MACASCGSETHPSANYCPQEDKSWGSVRMAPRGLSDKKTDRELKLYEQAKKEGNQPWGTSIRRGSKYTESEYAMAMADHLGRPYRADDMAATFYPEIAGGLKELTQEQKDAARCSS